MNDCRQELTDFYDLLQQNLQEKLACILFQFPPSFHFSPERLDNILQHTNKSINNVIEFRHLSWFNDAVFQAFEKEGLCFAGQSHPILSNEDVFIVNDFSYYRFHGKPVLFKSQYSVEQLAGVADAIARAATAYIFFNNTWGDAALINAREMQKLMIKNF